MSYRLGASDRRTESSSPRVVSRLAVRTLLMNLTDLSQENFTKLVTALVDDRLCDLLGDPDLGLPLDETVRARLKESLASSERITGDEIAEQLGLRW